LYPFTSGGASTEIKEGCMAQTVIQTEEKGSGSLLPDGSVIQSAKVRLFLMSVID